MTKKKLYRMIPKVDKLLCNKNLKKLIDKYGKNPVKKEIQIELDRFRKGIINNDINEENINYYKDKLLKNIEKNTIKNNRNKLKRVINATGIVIHTNLGRSSINKKVLDNIIKVSENYSNLEYDLKTGKRGSRYSHLEEILKEITNAESALVVNNNAAAVLLVLNTLAENKETIVSRGELIEIGGSFRIPEVMKQSGTKLVEVGTTNKTHFTDYLDNINEETASILKVHTSNYRILGFSESVDSEKLVKIRKQYNIPIIEDLGSGVLIDLSKYGLPYEPTVKDSIKKGVDIVTFSGDKLLGGPQAGIIVGKKEYIDKMKKNPLNRALRIDKFTISALESTLNLYKDEKIAVKYIPTLNMITMRDKELVRKSNYFYNILNRNNLNKYYEYEIVNTTGEVGGGSLPLEKLNSKAIKIKPKLSSINDLDKYFRNYKIPIISRIFKDYIYIDVRTVSCSEFEIITEALNLFSSS